MIAIFATLLLAIVLACLAFASWYEQPADDQRFNEASAAGFAAAAVGALVCAVLPGGILMSLVTSACLGIAGIAAYATYDVFDDSFLIDGRVMRRPEQTVLACMFAVATLAGLIGAFVMPVRQALG